jgi:hypothetical protein
LNSIIVPWLNSFAMIQVIKPLSLVHWPVWSNKYSIAISFTV